MPDRLLVQISDTHVVADGLLHDRVDSAGQLAAVLAGLGGTGHRPDAVLLTGDLADHGRPEEYQRLRQLLDAFRRRTGIPVILLPGNHDDRDHFRSALLDDAGSGPLDQVHWVGGLRVVALDTTVPGAHHGALADGQLDALAAELALPAPEGTIVALHHPPIPSPVRLVNLLSLREPERLAAVIAGRDVLMVLAGHAHHTSAGLLGGVPVWVATATAYQADLRAASDLLRGIPGCGYTRVDVAGGRAVASQVATAFGQPYVYEHPLAGLEARLAGLGAERVAGGAPGRTGTA